MKLIVRYRKFCFILFLLLALISAFILRYPVQFQSTLTDLITIKSINNEPLDQKPAQYYSSTLQVVVEDSDFTEAKKTSDSIFDALLKEKIINVFYQIPKNFNQEMIKYVEEYQNIFLSDPDRRDLLSSNFNYITQKSIQNIVSSWFPQIFEIKKDPFSLSSDFIKNLDFNLSRWQEKEGVLWQKTNEQNYILMTVHLSSETKKQLKQFEKIEKIIKPYQTHQNIYLSGAPRHMAKVYQKTQSEIFIFSSAAFVVLLILTFLLYQSQKAIFQVGLTLVISFISGFCGLLIFSDQIHILTFAFGSSLIGISVDYIFHRLSSAQKEHEKEVLKNIFYSFLTTTLCFVPLLVSSFRLLNQIAVFTIFGLIGTYLFVSLSKFEKTKEKSFNVLPLRFKYKIIYCVILGIFISFGVLKVNLSNAPKNLYMPDINLQKDEAVFQKLNGTSAPYILIVKGKSLQDALEKEEKIKLHSSDFFSLSTFVPSLKRQKENLRLVQKLFEIEAQNIKEKLHFKEDLIYQEPKLISNVPEFFKNMMFENNGFTYTITPIQNKIKIESKNAWLIEPQHMLQNALNTYALESYFFLKISFVVLLMILFVIYRKKAVLYLLPSLVGVLFAVSFFAIKGQAITFFHLLSLFLVMGLGIDYAIFHFEKSQNTDYKTVFFSFLSSFIGFGLISLTDFRLIAIMGETITIGLLVSYLTSLLLIPNTQKNTSSFN